MVNLYFISLNAESHCVIYLAISQFFVQSSGGASNNVTSTNITTNVGLTTDGHIAYIAKSTSPASSQLSAGG